MTPADLRARRQALGLSQTELARRLGVPRNTWWRWEAGRMPIERATMLALALDQLTCLSREDEDSAGCERAAEATN